MADTKMLRTIDTVTTVKGVLPPGKYTVQEANRVKRKGVKGEYVMLTQVNFTDAKGLEYSVYILPDGVVPVGDFTIEEKTDPIAA